MRNIAYGAGTDVFTFSLLKIFLNFWNDNLPWFCHWILFTRKTLVKHEKDTGDIVGVESQLGFCDACITAWQYKYRPRGRVRYVYCTNVTWAKSTLRLLYKRYMYMSRCASPFVPDSGTDGADELWDRMSNTARESLGFRVSVTSDLVGGTNDTDVMVTAALYSGC